MKPIAFVPIVTPHGHVLLERAENAAPFEAVVAERLEAAFTKGCGHGLLHLATTEMATILPPPFGWWRELGTRYVTALRAMPDSEITLVSTPTRG
ncbi:MAG: hypothetical protein ACK53X_02930, partial [Holosporales bacterium]